MTVKLSVQRLDLLSLTCENNPLTFSPHDRPSFTVEDLRFAPTGPR